MTNVPIYRISYICVPMVICKHLRGKPEILHMVGTNSSCEKKCHGSVCLGMELNSNDIYNKVEILLVIRKLCTSLSGCNGFFLEMLLGPIGYQLTNRLSVVIVNCKMLPFMASSKSIINYENEMCKS